MKPLKTIRFVDKSKVRALIARSYDKMGIRGEPIGAEKVQAQIAARGVKLEDNVFSRALLRAREE